jgi:O-antigen/teichoic acid export membrane protein
VSAGAASVIYARVLGPTNQGVYELVVSTVTVLAVLLALGYSTYAVVAAGRGEATGGELLGGAIILSGTVGVFSILAGWLLWPVLRGNVLGGMSFGLAMVSFASVLPTVLVSHLQELFIGIGRVRTLSITLVAVRLITDVSGIILILVFHTGLDGVIGVTVFNAVILAVVLSVWMFRNNSAPVFRFSIIRAGLSFGLKKYSGLVAGYLLLRMDLFVLNAIRGNRQVGVYSIAVAIAEQLWVLTTVFSRVAYPQVSGRTKADAAQLAAAVSRLSVMVSLLLAIGGALLAWPLIPMAFGASYGSAYIPLLLLLPGIAIQTSARAVDSFVAGNRNRPGVASGIMLVTFAAAVPVYAIFISAWGTIGAAIGSTVIYTLTTAISWVVYRRLAGPEAQRLLIPYEADLVRLWDLIRLRAGAITKALFKYCKRRLSNQSALLIGGIIYTVLVAAAISLSTIIGIILAIAALGAWIIIVTDVDLRVPLYAVILISGLLIAAPGIHPLNSAFTQHSQLFSPVVLFLVPFFVIGLKDLGKRSSKLVAAASSIVVISGASAALAGGDTYKSWLLTIMAPAAIFIVMVTAEVELLRKLLVWTEWALLAAVVIADIVFAYYARASAFSFSFVRSEHTNTIFWASAGRYSFQNPNNATIIYAAALGFGIAGWLGFGRRLHFRHVALTLLSILALFDTGSRGALVCIVAILGFALLRAGSKEQKGRGLIATAAILTILMAIGVWYIATQAGSNGARSFQTRVAANTAGIDSIFAHPLFGTGPGTASATISSNSTAQSVFGSNNFGSAHNLFLNFGVDTGLICVVILITLVLGAARRSLTRNPSALLPLLGYSLTGISAGFTVVNPSNPSWAFILWIVLAFAWRPEVMPFRIHHRRTLVRADEPRDPPNVALQPQRIPKLVALETARDDRTTGFHHA